VPDDPPENLALWRPSPEHDNKRSHASTTVSMRLAATVSSPALKGSVKIR